MKHLLIFGLVGLLFIGCGANESSQSDGRPTGNVLTAVWGDSRDSVRAVFTAQGLQMVHDSIDLIFTGGSFEGYTVDQWVLTFAEGGGFSSAVVSIAPDTTGTAVVTQGLETRLTEKFGAPVGPMMWKEDASSEHATTYSLMVADGNRVTLRIEGPIEHLVAKETRSETPSVE